MSNSDRLTGPDFLDSVADQSAAQGLPVNAAEFRQRATDWRADHARIEQLEADLARLERQLRSDTERARILDKLKTHLQAADEALAWPPPPTPPSRSPAMSANPIPPSAPVGVEDVEVLKRLRAALPDVGLNGWWLGVEVLDRVIDALAQQPAAAGEEIMVNAAHDVYTLPLQPSGLSSGPRFVVHVPGPEQPAAVDEAQGEAIRARRQQIAGWLEGLGQAARSLRTIADQAGKVEGMEDMEGVRGYANSRATVAEAALAANDTLAAPPAAATR